MFIFGKKNAKKKVLKKWKFLKLLFWPIWTFLAKWIHDLMVLLSISILNFDLRTFILKIYVKRLRNCYKFLSWIEQKAFFLQRLFSLILINLLKTVLLLLLLLYWIIIGACTSHESKILWVLYEIKWKN